MANLVSPGVQVQVIDESFYASSGPGTVPFIMMATAENKPQPGSTTSIAPGTVAANAGKLYLMTSQRELLQTFGNPTFVTQAGTPQHGNEINEYGLYSAYQYLGIANRAWVMRAPVDLATISPRSTEPTGMPANGDHWLDLSATSWGVFRSNGNINPSLSWGALAPIVISDAAQLVRMVQGKRARGNEITDANAPMMNNSGPMSISGVDVQMTSGDSLNTVVQSINTSLGLKKKGIYAEIYERVEKISATATATIYNLRINCTDVDTVIEFRRNPVPVDGDILTDLGFGSTELFPTNYILPNDSVGTLGSIAVNAVFYLTEPSGQTQVNGVSMFEKISVSTASGTRLRWFPIGTTDETNPGWGWREASPTVVSGAPTKIDPAANLFTIGNDALIGIGDSGLATFSITSNGVTGNGIVSELNAFFDAQGWNALASITTNGINSYLTITNYDGTNITVIDQSGNTFATAGIKSTNTFYGSVVGSVGDPTFITLDYISISVGDISAPDIQIPNPEPGETVLDAVVRAINTDTRIGTSELIKASAVEINGQYHLKIASTNNSFFTVGNRSGFTPNNPPMAFAGIPTGVTFGNQMMYQGYSLSAPQPTNVDQLASGNIWINTQPGNRGTTWSVRRYNIGTDTWQSRNAPLYLNDSAASAAYGANRVVGSLYVQYDQRRGNPTDPARANFVLRAWDGSSWINASQAGAYTQSYTEPTGVPEEGSLWFNATLRVDIMINDGTKWVGYKNAYPGTDTYGPLLSSTAPSYQSNGSNTLADNDIWIDTSDLENYPKIYRWDALNLVWNLIDNTDQSSSQGIVFGDARWNADGTLNGSQSTVDMLASDYVDADAPSALAYPVGCLLFNTRYSTYNVKEWRTDYLDEAPAQGTRDRWVTASGLRSDGSPYMGRSSQRVMVVRAMAGAMTANQELRSESNFFNLIAAPGYPELLDEMVTLNTDKKDIAFILVDTPARLAPDGVSISNWATNTANAPDNGESALITHSRYAGLYYPWGLATNLDGSPIFVPPSMTVLRTIAFNDQVAYPWFAPAGFNRGLVSAVSSVGYLSAENEYVPVSLSQGQRDALYSNSINPIAYIPGRGLVVYGQKTLNPISSALNRVNVSRLICYLNYELDNLAKPFLFEPNDQFTRAGVQRTFESFFKDLVSLRAVYDFAVLCDETNNTPTRIDRNELWIDVAIKPTKAIEFIYIPLRILNTGDPLPT